ncbi:MAG: sigma-54 dependent transcriptional regulator [Alkalispirochaeta sp.]|jgi:two-component system nitrogen regulation response regulator NtrX
MKTVLVVDDEAGIRETLGDILEDEGYTVQTAGDGLVALGILERELIDCILLDVWLPGKGGLEILETVRSDYPTVPVVIISGHGTIDMAVKAVKQGAYDFLEKPLSLERVTTVVRNAIEVQQLRRENVTLRNRVRPVQRIRGTSDAIRSVRLLIEQTAASDARVLITGENGTGKELVAREIHDRSERRHGPFVAVNCAAIPDTLIESELFGHEKGSFTGAAGERKGKFELADGGTLFLDEIADMTIGAQAKVLRAIQEMRFERIGSESSITTDVRIIAATNKEIREEIRQERFREDLYFRLNVVPVHMPALRDRTDDIPMLLNEFLQEAKADITVDEGALEVLQSYPWPGNVRELKNFVERVSIMAGTDRLTEKEVNRFLGNRGTAARMSPLGDLLSLSLSDARDSFERRYLTEKLREHDYNVARTAQDMGVYPSSLHARIKKFGIELKR